MAAARSWIVGLTGGIATGKSRVGELLEELGAALECSDRIVRELQAPGAPILVEIIRAFGEEYLLPSGELDRAKLGGLVFGDDRARKKLGRLIHPRVYGELARRMQSHIDAEVPVVVLDIPLLLESQQSGQGSGALIPFHEVVLVYADKATQIERIVERDGLSPDDARARIQSQIPIEKKRELADVVIENTGAWEKTDREVRRHFERWLSGPPESPG